MGAALTKTTIYEKLEGSSEYKSIGIIENNGTDPGYFNYREPKANTWYYVEFLAEQGVLLINKDKRSTLCTTGTT